MFLSVSKKRGLAALAAACLASVALPATPALAQKVKNKTPAAEASAPAMDYEVSIPSVETVGSNMDETTIKDILTGNLVGNAQALAGLDAQSITIPEITVTLDIKVDGKTERSTMSFTNLVLEDVSDGVAGALRLDSSGFTSPDGDALMGPMSAESFNIAAILAIYGLVEAGPSREMQTLYSNFLVEGGSFASEEVSCDIGPINGGEARARPFETSFVEIISLAQSLEDNPDDMSPELIGKVMRMYADLLTAMESTEFTFGGLDCAGTDSDGGEIAISVASITMGGMSPGIYPQISFDGVAIAADDGSMSLENFTLKQFDLTSVVETLASAPERVDESWLEANARKLVPAFEGFAASGFSMDIPDSENDGQRIIGDLEAFDLTLGQYINGIPTALDTWARGLRIDLPEDSEDEQLAQLLAFGITTIDAGFRIAAAWNEENSTIDIEEVSISGVDLASVAFKGTISNVTESLFSLDLDEAMMAGMDMAVKALSVDVVDSGLSDILLAVAGAEQGIDPATMRPVFAGLAEGTVLGMMAGAADAAKLGSALNAFVAGKAKSLNISIGAKADPGLSFEDFMIAQDDPTTLLTKVNISAAAK
jgi:hypothetical protein